MDPQPVAFFSFSFPFFVCLVACLETSFLFFLFFLASVSSGHGFRPSAAHHVNNRVMLQCVFHTELVWIRGLDWHAGLIIHTGYGIPAGRTGLARRTECCAASVRKPQTWGRRRINSTELLSQSEGNEGCQWMALIPCLRYRTHCRLLPCQRSARQRTSEQAADHIRA